MSGQNPQTEPNNPGQQPTSKTDTELTQLTVSLPEGLQLRSLTVFERFKAFYTTNIYGYKKQVFFTCFLFALFSLTNNSVTLIVIERVWHYKNPTAFL